MSVIDLSSERARRNSTNDQQVKPLVQTRYKSSISVFGLGYVGAVSAACLADTNHRVIGVDPDVRKTAMLARGQAVMVEPGLDDLLGRGVDADLIGVSADAEFAVFNSSVSFVCVGTPSREDGSCDTGYVESVARSIGKALASKKEFHVIAFRSTIPPGTCRQILAPIIEKESGGVLGEDFGIAFHPEFLRECTAIEDFYNPPKTVVGASDDKTARIVADIYAGVDENVLFTTIEAAEMVKYVDNTWHATKVCFANEVGRLAKACGVDSHEVMDVFVKDTKLNISPYYMKPGFAFGGSCLPKDVRGMGKLARAMSVDVPLIDALHSSNDSQIMHALSLVMRGKPRRVALLGLTFKKGTDDLRESPMLTLLEMMLAEGLDVSVFDDNLDLDTAMAHHLAHSKSGSSDADSLAVQMPRLVAPSVEQAVADADTVIVAHNEPAFARAIDQRKGEVRVVDLARVWPSAPAWPGYEGICW